MSKDQFGKQHIGLPIDMQLELERNTAEFAEREAAGELGFPSYPEFVSDLFKDMDTHAATFHHATTGISGEAGELLDASKKVWAYGKELDLKHVIEELGDIRFYYQAVLNMLGITDADVQAANRVKLMKRYPTGVFTKEHAIARLDKVGE